MKPRTLEETIVKASKTFPVIVLTGPRQSGKTTLLRKIFLKTHQYYNLENPDVRMRASQDPITFLKNISGSVILDEIQYVPNLLPYIKSLVDEDRKPGRWILTGSQNFALMEGISESLSGRAAILSLLPFSMAETDNLGKKTANFESFLKKLELSGSIKASLSDLILRGGYPELASHKKIDRQLWCGSYITTYLERDIRNLKQIGNLSQFEIFLRAIAVRTGQILDLAGVSREIGISQPTAKNWLSLLEASYQVFLVYPYFRNIGKRLVKRPKIYFTDTGLASYLMGIHTKEQLINSPVFGFLFETLILTDFIKRFYNFGQKPPIYFLQTRDGLEVDLVIDIGGKLNLFEIKASATLSSLHAASISRAVNDLKGAVGFSAIISNSEGSFDVIKNIHNIFWGTLILN